MTSFLEIPVAGFGNVQTGVSRDLDTAFLLSADYPGFVAYTIETTADFNAVGQVQLKCEAVSDPTVVVASTKQAASALLGLVNIQGTSRQVLLTWVPANFRLKLDTSLSTGSPTITIVDQIEVIFHDASV